MAKKETSADVLEQLSCTYLAIDELNKAIPRLNEDIEKSSELASEAQTKCQEVKELLSTAEDKASAFSEEASVGIEKIQKNVKTVQTIQSNIKKMIKDLPDFDEIKSTISSLSDHINQLEDKLDENLIRLKKEFNSRIEQLEKRLSNTSNNYRSIQELLDEKLLDESEDLTVLVVDKNWTGDYCFQIVAVSDGKACGINYKDGKYYSRRDDVDIYRKNYKLYDGPSLEAIKKEIKMNFE